MPLLISMTFNMIMSNNKISQSSDVPAAADTDVEAVSPLAPLLLSRQGNDDEAGCREVPVVPIGEVSVVAAEATTGVVPQQVVSLLLLSRQTTLPATPRMLWPQDEMYRQDNRPDYQLNEEGRIVLKTIIIIEKEKKKRGIG